MYEYSELACECVDMYSTVCSLCSVYSLAYRTAVCARSGLLVVIQMKRLRFMIVATYLSMVQCSSLTGKSAAMLINAYVVAIDN